MHATCLKYTDNIDKVVACTVCDAANSKGDNAHLWAIKGVTQGRDARKNLLHSLVEGCHCVVAALPQQHALHTKCSHVSTSQCYNNSKQESKYKRDQHPKKCTSGDLYTANKAELCPQILEQGRYYVTKHTSKYEGQLEAPTTT